MSMSVYIKGMEMPKDGVYWCEIGVADDIAMITIHGEDRKSFSLVPVHEPHGRLGDLDDIIKRAKKWLDHPDEYISQRNKDMIYILEKEDAIIPASGTEVE